MYMLFTIFLQFVCTYLKPFISNTKWYLMCLGTQLLIRFSLRLAPQLEYSFELNHVGMYNLSDDHFSTFTSSSSCSAKTKKTCCQRWPHLWLCVTAHPETFVNDQHLILQYMWWWANHCTASIQGHLSGSHFQLSLLVPVHASRRYQLINYLKWKHHNLSERKTCHFIIFS